jgi:CheY-like chemotaxis protein
MVRRVDEEMQIIVQDRGRGISAGRLSSVFDFFAAAERFESEGTQVEGGLGVGLGLVRRLVELHGGHIQAFSEGEGRGARFVVTLPLHPPTSPQSRPAASSATAAITGASAPPASRALASESSAAQGAAASPTAAAPPTAGLDAPPPRGAAKGARRVLVVDDNVDSATSLAMLLQTLGYEAESAHDGHEALVAAARFAPDIVLLDIGLPGLNGYEVASRLRERGDPQPLLIALTGWGQAEDRARARDAGFDPHLVKPVDLAALMRLLTRSER